MGSGGWSSFEEDLWSTGAGPVALGLAGGMLEALLALRRAQLTLWTVLVDGPDPVETLVEAARRPITVRSSSCIAAPVRYRASRRC